MRALNKSLIAASSFSRAFIVYCWWKALVYQNEQKVWLWTLLQHLLWKVKCEGEAQSLLLSSCCISHWKSCWCQASSDFWLATTAPWACYYPSNSRLSYYTTAWTSCGSCWGYCRHVCYNDRVPTWTYHESACAGDCTQRGFCIGQTSAIFFYFSLSAIYLLMYHALQSAKMLV